MAVRGDVGLLTNRPLVTRSVTSDMAMSQFPRDSSLGLSRSPMAMRAVCVRLTYDKTGRHAKRHGDVTIARPGPIAGVNRVVAAYAARGVARLTGNDQATRHAKRHTSVMAMSQFSNTARALR